MSNPTTVDESKPRTAPLPVVPMEESSIFRPWVLCMIRNLRRDLAEVREQAAAQGVVLEKSKKGSREYLTIREMIADVLPVEEGTVRWWIARDVQEFNTRCVTRRGRRIFIDRNELERWLAEGGPEERIATYQARTKPRRKARNGRRGTRAFNPKPVKGSKL